MFATVTSAPPAATWTRRHALHLLNRAGFGGTPEEIEQLVAAGRQAAVDRLLDFDRTPDPCSPPAWLMDPWIDTQARLPGLSREEMTRRHVSTVLRYRTEMDDLRLWWLRRMVETPRPLQEKMTLFWHWHFPTAQAKVNISQAHYLQNDLFRRHAVGRFRSLVQAVAVDPAMLMYLDGHQNLKEQPNENFARELMELFTMGIGNYTEADIREAARGLTGWLLDGLTPQYHPSAHDPGAKTVFGKTAELDPGQVVDLCVDHPATAMFLCGKLVRYFGAADPEGTLTRRLAEVFRASGTELRPVLRTLFTAPEFYSEASLGTQIKCPVQLLVGTLRLLKAEFTPTRPLAQALALMGQDLFNPPNVKGWVTGREMISTTSLMVRYHLAEMVLENRMPDGIGPLAPERQRVMRPDEESTRPAAVAALLDGERKTAGQEQKLEIRFDPARLFPQGVPAAPEALVSALAERLLVRPVEPHMRRALTEAAQAAPESLRARTVVRLILSSPEYQLA